MLKENWFYINYEVYKDEKQELSRRIVPCFILTMRYIKLKFVYIPLPTEQRFILTMRYIKARTVVEWFIEQAGFILTMRYIKLKTLGQ
ncbi:hypothetical protein U732_4239 [Clostridium argentinense CDC 2741]|uniref:Uncharacterized protein n=1 Tax=Clostridium argentinense CDC 2741 TaxID=1418104 RepID=A0A0C1UMM4_9CLOT|nr:hypothetical protein [Clostridium argentinense]KIE48465.1 hypothetical protein U732_4239 [Clostridium argentinense CDC 2741]NFP51911.1 hypothetical protein [Clostridium argentinense]